MASVKDSTGNHERYVSESRPFELVANPPINKPSSWQNKDMDSAMEDWGMAPRIEKYGEKKVLAWRRSWDLSPPPMKTSDSRHPIHNNLYGEIDREKTTAIT